MHAVLNAIGHRLAAAASPSKAAYGSRQLVTGAVGCLLFGLSSVAASLAQNAPKPAVHVAPTMLIEPAAETPLPIQVGPAESVPRNSFLRIRGLPAAASLSEGHSISPGAWAIPLIGLSSLKVAAPAGMQGKSDISIALVAVDGTVLAETRAALVFASAALIAPGGRPPDTGQQQSIASLGTTPSTPVPSAAARLERPIVPAPPPLTEAQQQALKYIDLGDKRLAEGNIKMAQLFYQRAADAGLAQGAMALAGTYDPAELARLQVQGLQPDAAAARKWYERARELGAPEAGERLRRLGAR